MPGVTIQTQTQTQTMDFSEPTTTSFPGSLILPPTGGDKMRDPGNEVEPTNNGRSVGLEEFEAGK